MSTKFDINFKRITGIIFFGAFVIASLWGIFEMVNSRPVSAQINQQISNINTKIEKNEECLNDLTVKIELECQKIENTNENIDNVNKNLENINIKLYDFSINQGTMEGRLKIIQDYLLKD